VFAIYRREERRTFPQFLSHIYQTVPIQTIVFTDPDMVRS